MPPSRPSRRARSSDRIGEGAVGQETPDDAGELVGARVEEEMAAPLHDVKAAGGDLTCHDASIDEWHDRIVVTGEYEGAMWQPVEPRQARPSAQRRELVEVAQQGRRPGRPEFGVLRDEVVLETDLTSIEGGCDTVKVGG
jgi:hypothetical protein